MNLTHKSNAVLLADAQNIRQDERDDVAALLYHVIEIERRDLHLQQGFGSINAFLEKTYGYSRDEAGFRVSAIYDGGSRG